MRIVVFKTEANAHRSGLDAGSGTTPPSTPNTASPNPNTLESVSYPEVS